MTNGERNKSVSNGRRRRGSTIGWVRFGRYRWLRLLRISDSPRRLARGVFAGTFVAFTPFFGFHLLLAPMLALLVRGNVLASLAAAFICNPLTFPAVAVASYGAGALIIGAPAEVLPAEDTGMIRSGLVTIREELTALFTPAVFDAAAFAESVRIILLPYLIGGILLGAVSGAFLAWLSYRLISAYQVRRRQAAARTLKLGGRRTGGRL